jgi:hypothetical protein
MDAPVGLESTERVWDATLFQQEQAWTNTNISCAYNNDPSRARR